MNTIGTLGESSLHAALKKWYAQPGDQFEVSVDGAIIDIVRDDLLIEIQTRNFMGIKRKLSRLSDDHTIRLIYPIASEKWIVRLDKACKTQISRRKSPRRGRIDDLFMELVNIAALLKHPNLTLEVAFIREEEVWSQAKTHRRMSRWRGGWARHDRRLIDVVEQKVFATPRDYLSLLPEGLPELFTNHELSHALGRPRYLAERMSYSLRQIGVLEVAGKRGRLMLFRRIEIGD
jgi:hypothetical protein